jgi:hypothetical protein
MTARTAICPLGFGPMYMRGPVGAGIPLWGAFIGSGALAASVRAARSRSKPTLACSPRVPSRAGNDRPLESGRPPRSKARSSFGTPHVHVIRSPKADAVAERFVGTVRRECLDWILIANRRHLKHALRKYIDHYNGHRPHRALSLTPPEPRPQTRFVQPPAASVRRNDRLGGLIHEYAIAT